MSMITKLVCFECRLCNKYLDTETTAEIHTRTFNHHRMFVKFLNEKANETKIAQKRAAAAASEEDERQKRIKLDSEAGEDVKPAQQDLYDPSEATGDDDVKETKEGEEPVKPEEVATTSQPAAAAETPAVLEEDVDMKDESAPVAAPPAPVLPATPAAATTAASPAVQSTPSTPQQQQQKTPNQQQNTPNNRGGSGNRGRRGRRGGNRGGYGGGRY
jgi:hypothetical protein